MYRITFTELDTLFPRVITRTTIRDVKTFMAYLSVPCLVKNEVTGEETLYDENGKVIECRTSTL